MMPELRPLEFGQASNIRATCSGACFREDGCCEVVVVSYSGRYREGGKGKPDSRTIHAYGQAAVIAWEPLGVILDFSELEYVGGDNIRDILDIGERALGIEGLPLAIVVGPRCEEAVRSALDWGYPSLSRGWIFGNFGEAWECIQEELADLRTRYGSILPRPISIEPKGNADER